MQQLLRFSHLAAQKSLRLCTDAINGAINIDLFIQTGAMQDKVRNALI